MPKNDFIYDNKIKFYIDNKAKKEYNKVYSCYYIQFRVIIVN
jgi:hypothetical protein